MYSHVLETCLGWGSFVVVLVFVFGFVIFVFNIFIKQPQWLDLIVSVDYNKGSVCVCVREYVRACVYVRARVCVV